MIILKMVIRFVKYLMIGIGITFSIMCFMRDVIQENSRLFRIRITCVLMFLHSVITDRNII